MISQQEVIDILQPIMATAKQSGLEPTFFELTTMLAFKFFQQEKVDYAVLETGLGYVCL